jgi:exonuclease III
MQAGMKSYRGRWWKTKGKSRTPSTVPKLRQFFFKRNFNGVHRASKRNNLLAMQMEHDWGIMLLADTRIHDLREVPSLNKMWKCKEGFWSKGTPNVGGTAILFYKPVVVRSYYHDAGGRFSRVDYLWEGESFSAISIYAPANASERKLSLQTISFHTCKSTHLLKGASLAVISTLSKIQSWIAAQAILVELLVLRSEISDCFSLTDVFRNFHPKKVAFTFYSAAHRMQTRLDRVYCNHTGSPYANSCRHVSVPSVISDHQAGVEVTIRAIGSVTRGPSFWKLNCSLLRRPGFQKLVRETIKEFVSSKTQYGSIEAWWDMLKFAIQFRAKHYSKEQAFRRKRTIQVLEKDLSQVNVSLSSQPSDASLYLRRARLDTMLAEYYEDIREAARLKARMKYKTQGEKPTKYFTALVKQRSQKSNLTSLKVDRNGLEISLTTVEEILEEASNFYAELYTRKVFESGHQNGINFLDKNVASTLSKSERALCDQPVSEKELKKALDMLPSGKVPGIDGLPAEFFKEFWSEIKTSFLEVLHSSFANGALPETMRTSVITLIYKKKARDDLKNYRPISLLCSDYKIIAKALAERIKVVLPTIIHRDQTGFLKDRYIGENITLFLDSQEYLSRNQKTGFAFLADWEKAYDRIDRRFIEQCLTAFGFGPNCVLWFKVLHKDSFAQVIVNGFLTESFDVQRGVRQGCPWAPFLFLIGIEPLACALQKDQTIKGFSLPRSVIINYFTVGMQMILPSL